MAATVKSSSRLAKVYSLRITKDYISELITNSKRNSVSQERLSTISSFLHYFATLHLVDLLAGHLKQTTTACLIDNASFKLASQKPQREKL